MYLLINLMKLTVEVIYRISKKNSLQQVNLLNIDSKSISTIDILQDCSRLVVLWAKYNLITSVSPLVNTNQLWELDLRQNPVSLNR